MTLCYILGTIFPQGTGFEEYSRAGGRYLSLVKGLSLLEIFTSPLFLALSLLLCLNLFICIFERLRKLRTRRELLNYNALIKNPGIVDIGPAKKFPEIEMVLTDMGLRMIDADERQYVFGKGAPYWWLSWIYHLGIIVAIAGFLLTALTAHEHILTLWPGKTEKLSLYSPETRLNRYKKLLDYKVPDEIPGREFSVTLKKFSTEYYQSLRFDYPGDWISRLSMGLGWKSIKPARETGLSPKMWKTEFTIRTPDGRTIDAEAWVNHPFRFRGLTLYQMGYDQRMTLEVEGKKMGVEVFQPFEAPGIEGKFIARTVKHGRVHRKDGSVDTIKPRFDLLYQPPGRKKKEPLGTVYLEVPTGIKGKVFTFRNLREASVLSYRIDLGVPVIAVSTLLVFLGLVFRSYGYWYRVRIVQKDSRLLMAVSTRGLLANKEKVFKRLGVTIPGRLEGFLDAIRAGRERFFEMKPKGGSDEEGDNTRRREDT